MYIYIYTYTYAYDHIYIYISTSIAYVHPVESVKQMCTYADVHNICQTYTPAHAWCATTPVNTCRLFAKKCIYTRVCAPIQLFSSFFVMEAIANLS